MLFFSTCEPSNSGPTGPLLRISPVPSPQHPAIQLPTLQGLFTGYCRAQGSRCTYYGKAFLALSRLGLAPISFPGASLEPLPYAARAASSAVRLGLPLHTSLLTGIVHFGALSKIVCRLTRASRFMTLTSENTPAFPVVQRPSGCAFPHLFCSAVCAEKR